MKYGVGELDKDCVGNLGKVVVVQQVGSNLADCCLANPDCGLQTRLSKGSSHKALHHSLQLTPDHLSMVQLVQNLDMLAVETT